VPFVPVSEVKRLRFEQQRDARVPVGVANDAA